MGKVKLDGSVFVHLVPDDKEFLKILDLIIQGWNKDHLRRHTYSPILKVLASTAAENALKPTSIVDDRSSSLINMCMSASVLISSPCLLATSL